MKSVFTGLVLILVLSCGCNSSSKGNSEDKHRTEEKEPKADGSSKPKGNDQTASKPTEKRTNKGSLQSKQCKPIESIFMADKMPKSMGKYEVKNMEQVGECLRITIQHSGKTALAKFHLIWNGAVMKSLPPIAILKLEGSIFEDSGKSVTQELDFNLDALKTFGQRITIRLDKHEVEPVRFTFQ